jgi:DNA-binding NarL/FixJ family response regulator
MKTLKWCDSRVNPEVATWEYETDVSRVLIVDDHPGFRRFARSLLESEGFDVVGEARDEASALAAAARLRPGLVLLDVLLPGRDGFAIASELHALDPSLAIVLTSSRPADEFGARLQAAPVAGFVHKDDLSGAALAAVVG